MFEKTSKAVVEVLVVLCVFACTCSAVAPLPGIKARTASPYAEFYNVQMGESFSSIDANYVQLYRITGFHSTFKILLKTFLLKRI
jgi:hypothetical protein